MKINAIIVEDELNNRNNLSNLLKNYCPQIAVGAACSNAKEALKAINELKPQLIFLDIQMPGKNAFQLLQELEFVNFEIIFITAYSEYGIQAVKFSAIDYLLKPIDIEELKTAIDKAAARLEEKDANRKLENLLHYLQHSDKAERRIAIHSLKETRLIYIKDILRCESQNTYTFFYLIDGEKILSTMPIAHYEELLADYGFLRCHQSHLVNKKFVKSFVNKNGYFLILNDGSDITVSRLRKDFIKSNLIGK
ncbi:MAG: response regulator transcription factor [Bacteroidetes bacterium]|nr:response regulator transcription factor [Bacteroidota bacterium]